VLPAPLLAGCTRGALRWRFGGGAPCVRRRGRGQSAPVSAFGVSPRGRGGQTQEGCQRDWAPHWPGRGTRRGFGRIVVTTLPTLDPKLIGEEDYDEDPTPNKTIKNLFLPSPPPSPPGPPPPTLRQLNRCRARLVSFPAPLLLFFRLLHAPPPLPHNGPSALPNGLSSLLLSRSYFPDVFT